MRTLAIAAALFLACAGPASAQTRTDALGQCLVKSTTRADKQDMMAWVFVAMSAHPDLQAYSSITEAQREARSADMARLMLRLLAVDCRAETRAAMKADPKAIETAFGFLGEMAMEGLMGHPKVESEVDRLNRYIDPKVFQSLLEPDRDA